MANDGRRGLIIQTIEDCSAAQDVCSPRLSMRRLNDDAQVTACDVDQPFPFENDVFDTVFSSANLCVLKEKAGFLQECHRILRPGGTARVMARFQWSNSSKRPPTQSPLDVEYRSGWQIWDEGMRVPAKRYLRRFESIEIHQVDRDYACIEIAKRPILDLRLFLVASVDTQSLCSGWKGVKSIYTTQKHVAHFWKSGHYIEK